MTRISTASSSAVSARPIRAWPTWASAWPSPGRSLPVTATAGTGPGPASRLTWPSRARQRWRQATGSAPAASCCGLPSTSGKHSSITGTTWTVRNYRPPTRRACKLSGTPCPCSTTTRRYFPTAYRAICSPRVGRTARCRSSCMSEGMTAPPKSCTPRQDRHWSAATASPPSTAQARDRCCMTSGSPCARTGRRWFPEWSMR